MKRSKCQEGKTGCIKSFAGLGELITKKNLKLTGGIRFSKNNPNSYPRSEPPCKYGIDQPQKIIENGLTDEELFLKAMSDVVPLKGNTKVVVEKKVECLPFEEKEDKETYKKLTHLIRTGKGFVVSDTPEYIEGCGYNVDKSVADKLHRGDFSIQAHIDLHGFTVDAARIAFEEFIKDSVNSGKRAVLIVHGRGLSSPNEPVLKTQLKTWLTKGPWRKWVIAFTSAKSYDGGAGATYVLLRRRPWTKKYRKEKRSWDSGKKKTVLEW